MRQLFNSFFVTLLFVSGITSYGSSAGIGKLFAAEADQKYVDRMGELDKLIKAEIGDARASDLAQCRSIPFGAKACGGPATYLAYSTAFINEAKLKALVDAFNSTSRSYIEARKILSDCRFVSEPKLELVNGICKLQ